MLSFNTKKGKELKIPYHASAAAARNSNLPYTKVTVARYSFHTSRA